MKTIVTKTTNISKYLFNDGAAISMSKQNIVTPNFTIGDMNSTNAVVHEGITPPDDWTGNKYLFDGSNWTANPDWDEPVEEGSE